MRRNAFEYFINALGVVLTVFILYSFIFVVVHAGNEVECLEKGYPDVRTTWNLEGYCVNIDGAVTGVVEELE